MLHQRSVKRDAVSARIKLKIQTYKECNDISIIKLKPTFLQIEVMIPMALAMRSINTCDAQNRIVLPGHHVTMFPCTCCSIQRNTYLFKPEVSPGPELVIQSLVELYVLLNFVCPLNCRVPASRHLYRHRSNAPYAHRSTSFAREIRWKGQDVKDRNASIVDSREDTALLPAILHPSSRLCVELLCQLWGVFRLLHILFPSRTGSHLAPILAVALRFAEHAVHIAVGRAQRRRPGPNQPAVPCGSPASALLQDGNRCVVCASSATAEGSASARKKYG